MAEHRQVHVALAERAYHITIGTGLLASAGGLIAPYLAGGKALVIADCTVADLYGARLVEALAVAGVAAELATFPAGETNKSVRSAEALWLACAESGIDRSGAIIALGGGVTGDLAGWVAASWMRGIAFIQVPTTLLAMVDSSVGGKTGVNSAAGKNLIGAFKQPRFVLIDPEVLGTMDQREYRAGLAEVAKYGVIHDPTFLAWQEAKAPALLARDAEAVLHAVAESCRIKAHYVVEDEEEHGIRAELNYGHTFGHALERETSYTRYLHGEAVAIGMEMAADLAARIGVLQDASLPDRQRALLGAYHLPVRHACAEPTAAAERMTRATLLDKKARQGRTRFILPEVPGRMRRVEAPDPAQVTASFLACMAP